MESFSQHYPPFKRFADRGHLHRELGLHLEFVHLAFDRCKLNGYVHHGVGAHVFPKGVRCGLRWNHGSLRDYPTPCLRGLPCFSDSDHRGSCVHRYEALNTAFEPTSVIFLIPAKPFLHVYFIIVITVKNCYDLVKMDVSKILEIIKNTESPLKRQLLMVGLITRLLEEHGKKAPVVIGGCALSYYSREVYFTTDIDLAYAEREALDSVLKSVGFKKKGRYWVNEGLKMAIEAPTSKLAAEEAPVEIVEVGEGLQCTILGIEDLIIDRMNACKHWKSAIDCEMVELLVNRYYNDLDWPYLGKKAVKPENDILSELQEIKKRTQV